MARSRRPAASKPGARPGSLHALDELAALRGELRRAPAAGAPKHKAPPLPAADVTDTAAAHELFLDAVRGVQPLLKAGGRADIETPKPAPVPRARSIEPDDEIEAAPPRRTGREAPLDDDALFRLAVGDITPMKPDDHVVLAPRPHSMQARRAGNAPHGEPEFDSLSLPPDADAFDPADLFRHAVRGVTPVDARNRVELAAPPPPPEPLQHAVDEQAALRESLEAPMSLEDRLEMGDEAVFLRPGLPRRVLTDLRRGRWVLQGEVDLHGFNRDEAREVLSRFLATSLQQGRRCVRVIHGKGLGSPGKLSILKQLSRGWLAQREEILAFCQAGPYEGGSGALLVLLRAGTPPKE